MKNIRFFLSENFHFLVVKFSVYLNRHVFIMEGSDQGPFCLLQGILVLVKLNTKYAW